MELLLSENGYSKGIYSGEWVKESWTIRITDKHIEAFDEFGKDFSNKYILVDNTLENLSKIIEEIG